MLWPAMMIRTLQNRLAERWVIGLIGAVLCALVTMLVTAGSGVKHPGPWLEGLSHDVLVSFQSHGPVSGVTVVAMDEGSYRDLGQQPGEIWNRQLHADLIRQALSS